MSVLRLICRFAGIKADDMTQITRNAISVEHTAIMLYVEKGIILYGLVKNIQLYCQIYSCFNTTLYLSFSKSQPRLYSQNILKISQISALIFL